MLWFYRIIFGFLRVRFYGDYKEKILSICANNGITLWNSKTNEKGIESSLLVKDFKFLRKITKGQKIRVHILKKRGLPFIIQRYRHRTGILVGVVIFFCFLEIMSSYIWIIDINGNNKVTDKEILNACENIDVREGIKSDSFYAKIKREKLLLELDKIAWCSLNVEGSRLTINVTETKEEKDKKGYSNIKAGADGIIERIDIVSGTSVVKIGDAVKKGDLLVSGIVETANDTRFTYSKGKVTAKTQREIVLKEKYVQKLKVPTGRVKNKLAVDFFGFKIPFYLGKEKERYISSVKVYNCELFDQKLPIRFYKKRFEFYKEKEIRYDFDRLCILLEKELEKEITKLNCESIRIDKKKFAKNKDEVTLNATVTLRENIAVEDVLLISAGN